MTRDEAITRLQGHSEALRADGVTALYLFGSTARDDASEESDVDMLYEVEDARFSLLDQIRLQRRLETVLDAPVDLATLDGLRPFVRSKIERDMVRVF